MLWNFAVSFMQLLEMFIKLTNDNNNNGIASCQEREQSPTKVRRLMADKLLSYAAHDGEGHTTIHPRMSLPLGDVGMGDIPATNTVK